ARAGACRAPRSARRASRAAGALLPRRRTCANLAPCGRGKEVASLPGRRLTVHRPGGSPSVARGRTDPRLAADRMLAKSWTEAEPTAFGSAAWRPRVGWIAV